MLDSSSIPVLNCLVLSLFPAADLQSAPLQFYSCSYTLADSQLQEPARTINSQHITDHEKGTSSIANRIAQRAITRHRTGTTNGLEGLCRGLQIEYKLGDARTQAYCRDWKEGVAKTRCWTSSWTPSRGYSRDRHRCTHFASTCCYATDNMVREEERPCKKTYFRSNSGDGRTNRLQIGPSIDSSTRDQLLAKVFMQSVPAPRGRHCVSRLGRDGSDTESPNGKGENTVGSQTILQNIRNEGFLAIKFQHTFGSSSFSAVNDHESGCTSRLYGRSARA